MKYGEYFPAYLSDTELPIIISRNYINPKIDIKISDVIAKKLKEEIKNKAIESIKDKIRDKIQSDINLKLPFKDECRISERVIQWYQNNGRKISRESKRPLQDFDI